MSPRVKLSDIIKIISFQSYNTSYYFDREKGELFLVSKEQLRDAQEDAELEDYPEWEKEQVRFARKILADGKEEKYIEIPDKFVSYEYSTMENFCLSLKDEKISKSLCRAILGAGAFNRFNNCIHRYGIADDWYKYRYNSMKRIIIDWCESNDIEYIEEINPFEQMVKNWKASYLSQVDGVGGNEYLVKDFWEEIEENILPYVESADFSRWAFQQVKDLERLIKEIESNGLLDENIIPVPR